MNQRTTKTRPEVIRAFHRNRLMKILVAILLITLVGCSYQAAENPSGKGNKITVQLPGGALAKKSGDQ